MNLKSVHEVKMLCTCAPEPTGSTRDLQVTTFYPELTETGALQARAYRSIT